MKAFLYMYPIKTYVDFEMKQWQHFKFERYENDYINKVIDSKYRKNGYKVAYVCFKNLEGSIDKEILSNLFQFKRSDLFINAEVTFDEMCSSVYPDEEKLISYLLPISELVVAGFHRESCVKRVADKAEVLGISSKIDRTLTEAYFYLITKGRDLEKSLEDLDRRAEIMLAPFRIS